MRALAIIIRSAGSVHENYLEDYSFHLKSQEIIELEKYEELEELL